MDIRVYLAHYLDGKTRQRAMVFEEAASTSVLMHGVKYLCQHFYHLFDWFCKCYMLLRLRWQRPHTAGNVWQNMGRLYADAIDTYHVLWVIATFACYLIGWHLYDSKGAAAVEDDTKPWTATEWWLCIIPLTLCVYRIFEIVAALVEIYFRPSDTKHHQFRILIHASLHYLAAGFAFALFYVFADWTFDSFYSTNDTGADPYQFGDWSEPIYYSLMTIVAFGGNDEPQNWQGKWLNLIEMALGFMLVTFIFMNITQIWTGSRADAE